MKIKPKQIKYPFKSSTQVTLLLCSHSCHFFNSLSRDISNKPFFICCKQAEKFSFTKGSANKNSSKLKKWKTKKKVILQFLHGLNRVQMSHLYGLVMTPENSSTTSFFFFSLAITAIAAIKIFFLRFIFYSTVLLISIRVLR